MSFENNIRSFAIAAFNCSGGVFGCGVALVMDGIEITMMHKDMIIKQRVLWHDLALSRVPWGQIYIDDMKAKIIRHSRIQP